MHRRLTRIVTKLFRIFTDQVTLRRACIAMAQLPSENLPKVRPSLPQAQTQPQLTTKKKNQMRRKGGDSATRRGMRNDLCA